MFDFQKLDVYKKAKIQYKNISRLIDSKIFSKTVKDQLTRASLSTLLNIAEGTGRMSKASRRNFYVIARGSVFECVAIIEIMNEENLIDNDLYIDIFNEY